MYGDLRVSYHLAMVEEFAFLPSAIVVGDNADARGTEAVKLSVKLLSGLTLIALVAVAVVGLSHSASAAVDGKVYVTNVASNLTTEASPPSGRTNASTVYGTYDSAATTGTSARDIVTDSDKFIVTVVDADLNTTETVTADQDGAGAGYDYFATASGAGIISLTDTGTTGFQDVGDQFRVVFNDATKPIVGSASDIRIVKVGTSTVVTGLTVSDIFSTGDGVAAPVVTVNVVGVPTHTGNLEFEYPSSQVNVVTATIKSVVATTGSVVTLTETGRNTGRFEGYVQVLERTSTFTQGDNGGAVDDPATIAAVGGPITVSYNDAATSGTATNVARTASLSIDVTPPTATITTPTTGSESQNRLPTFTGNVTDNQSGLDISTFELRIDRNDSDAANTVPVITPGAVGSSIGTQGTIASIDLSANSDGTSTIAFSYTETTPLPDGATNPDNILDFQARQADLAGNYGYSDSDSADDDETTGRHGAQPHTIKIDQVIPQISSAETGKAWDATLTTPAEKSDVRDSIVVRFDGKVKDSSVSASDFQVVLSGAGGTFVPASILVQGSDVYLDLDSTIPSDNKPTVKIQGTIQDLAGNSTDAGSAVAADKLSPVITVTRSAGSGTGSGSEAADSLTADKMTITVSSDEDLQGPPAFTVTDLQTTPLALYTSTLGVAQGSNTWNLVTTRTNGVSGAKDGGRAVKVVATDSAGNAATSGDDTTKAFTVDSVVSTPASTPANGGTTTLASPFLTTDYSAGSEVSSVTITEATLNGEDVTSSVIASADSKTFFFQPTGDLALGNKEHTYVVKAKDAAGNELTTTTKFTKVLRTDFVVELFAGWNAISFPSNPDESDINVVFSNAGIQQVVAYDATTPSQPWRAASKKTTTDFVSVTTPGLTSVTAGPGYWVETTNFEDQKVTLEGPKGTDENDDDSPQLVTIKTGNGWNFVGVVDQSRAQTQADHKGTTLTRPNASGTDVSVTNSTYFNTVNNGRAYTFDTVTAKFREQVGTDDVKIGSGIWVFISPQDNGQLPHIVP